jgi:hypothetical protein
MNSVNMKIVGYDEDSQSLLVSFASDVTKSQDPEQYPTMAFQPLAMWPDVTDMVEVKKRLAIAGMHHVERLKKKEDFLADPNKVASLKSLVGQSFTYQVSDLTKVESELTTPILTV